MSSKSRKKTNQQARSASSDARTSSQVPAASTAPKGPASSGLDADEYIHVPKETSKLRFILMIALVIVLLIIFIVPSAIMGMGGTPDERTTVRWEHPSKGSVAIGEFEFTKDKRHFDSAIRIDMFMPYVLGLEDPPNITDRDTLRLIVLDELAIDAGVIVTDESLAEYLKDVVTRGFGGDANAFKGYAQNQMGGIQVAQETVRRLLRGKRYLDMVGYVAGVPDPAKIEELWSNEHTSYAFDYAEVEVAGLEDEARAALPDDATLESWFEDLDEADRADYLAPERRRAEVVSFLLDGGATPDGLLEAFPRDEAVPADEQAQNYFNRVSFIRFRRPDPEEPAEGEEPVDPPPSPYYSFDEVKETCLAEAPVYYALETWLEKLRERQTAGETIDLCAEAVAYGLACRAQAEGMTLEDYGTALEDIGGSSLAIHVFNTGVDQFAFGVQTQEGALSILRVVEVVEPAARPFAEVRDQVADDWVSARAAELAIERLEAVRTTFAEYVPEPDEDEEGAAGSDDEPDEPEPRRTADEAGFRAAVEAAGMSIARRDWLDKADLFTGDPDQDNPAHVFLRSKPEYYELDGGDVPAPALDSGEEYAYLVRLVGSKEVPIDEMGPGDYTRYKSQSAAGVLNELRESFSGENFETLYDVVWELGNDSDDEDWDDEDYEDEDLDEEEGDGA